MMGRWPCSGLPPQSQTSSNLLSALAHGPTFKLCCIMWHWHTAHEQQAGLSFLRATRSLPVKTHCHFSKDLFFILIHFQTAVARDRRTPMFVSVGSASICAKFWKCIFNVVWLTDWLTLRLLCETLYTLLFGYSVGSNNMCIPSKH